jgi:hypothetical protein
MPSVRCTKLPRGGVVRRPAILTVPSSRNRRFISSFNSAGGRSPGLSWALMAAISLAIDATGAYVTRALIVSSPPHIRDRSNLFGYTFPTSSLSAARFSRRAAVWSFCSMMSLNSVIVIKDWSRLRLSHRLSRKAYRNPTEAREKRRGKRNSIISAGV